MLVTLTSLTMFMLSTRARWPSSGLIPSDFKEAEAFAERSFNGFSGWSKVIENTF